MAYITPLSRHRRTVAVYPLAEIRSLVAMAYELETMALRDGLDVRKPLILPSGNNVPMSPRLRSIHLLGARCCNCAAAAQWVVEKKTRMRDRSLMMFVEDPEILPPTDIQVDHVIPASLGGPSDVGNLVPLCGTCNVRKSCRQTHATERRWRVRTLFEALLTARPDLAGRAWDEYRRFRAHSFCSEMSSRGAATYARDDALRFVIMLGGSGSLDLDAVASVQWPSVPLEFADGTPDVQWLRNLACSTQRALESLPHLRQMPAAVRRQQGRAAGLAA